MSFASTSPPSGGWRVAPVTPEDIPAAARTLSHAFAHDPHVTGMFPWGASDERLLRLFRRTLTEAVDAEAPTYLVPGRNGADPKGVAMWEAPGAKIGMRSMLPGAVQYLRVFGRKLPAALATELVKQRHHPDDPHWYLKAIGVRAGLQGSGVGSALMRHGLACADDQGRETYLECSTYQLVTYYERFGFEFQGTLSCVGTSCCGRMWRPAQS